MLAAEGVFALTLPLVIGPWSDTFHTPLGRRRPFMLVAVGPIGFCLALMAFMPNLWTTALLVFAFFFAYYVYEPPYRGLYPDLLPERVYGRAQGVQHLFRGIALGGGLIGGGILFHLWQPAPFLFAAGIVTAACLVPVLFLREDGGHGRVFEGVGDVPPPLLARPAPEPRRRPVPARERRLGGHVRRSADVRRPLHHRRPRRAALDLDARPRRGRRRVRRRGPRRGPGRRPVRPRAGDHVVLARLRARRCSGAGSRRSGTRGTSPSSSSSRIFAGAVMTLAWGLLFKLMPPDDRGAIAGLATTTKGIGLIFGTLLAGILIDVLRPYLPATDGYQVLWPILAVPILLAVPLVVSLIGPEQARRAEFTAGS